MDTFGGDGWNPGTDGARNTSLGLRLHSVFNRCYGVIWIEMWREKLEAQERRSDESLEVVGTVVTDEKHKCTRSKTRPAPSFF
jgi:hypothetical protein